MIFPVPARSAEVLDGIAFNARSAYLHARSRWLSCQDIPMSVIRGELSCRVDDSVCG